ncbi:hypothetical protein LEP1GSC008_3618 [Leptospira kirschneri serovar Bulgarica str. Nikolaevo]|uniref:Uncharacterized protein n=1 Tax=Leptospira kirschneri serovar Bulgarica str. Nikolaevo TaxID=1240687 RepID=M6FJ14_9LEPT|nr:hypothetical protein LEP1GSC008_3618 [Leptospira kirschneri serovar Bulgarica str. Nikolaevo]
MAKNIIQKFLDLYKQTLSCKNYCSLLKDSKDDFFEVFRQQVSKTLAETENKCCS